MTKKDYNRLVEHIAETFAKVTDTPDYVPAEHARKVLSQFASEYLRQEQHENPRFDVVRFNAAVSKVLGL